MGPFYVRTLLCPGYEMCTFLSPTDPLQHGFVYSPSQPLRTMLNVPGAYPALNVAAPASEKLISATYFRTVDTKCTA